jgi:hypothetical protein
MYTGTLIEQLIATVERTEHYNRQSQPIELERWYAAVKYETKTDQNLLGVA